jgi:hypothetical protein
MTDPQPDTGPTCDRCGPAVPAVYGARRDGELYLCQHCANRFWSALCAQGWTILPAGAALMSVRWLGLE